LAPRGRARRRRAPATGRPPRGRPSRRCERSRRFPAPPRPAARRARDGRAGRRFPTSAPAGEPRPPSSPPRPAAASSPCGRWRSAPAADASRSWAGPGRMSEPRGCCSFDHDPSQRQGTGDEARVLLPPQRPHLTVRVRSLGEQLGAVGLQLLRIAAGNGDQSNLSQRPVTADQLTLLLLDVSELALMLQGGSHADPATGSITGLPRRLPPARLAQCLLLIARLLDDRHRVPEVSGEEQLVQEPEASPVL